MLKARTLATAYDPDVEYVEGALEAHNVGDWLHSLIQRNIIVALTRKYPRLYAVPELRAQVTNTRFPLPDVAVLRQPPRTKYFADAPFIAIEMLSEEDKMTRVMEKLAEYEAKGVPYIWVIDPRLRTMVVYRSGDLTHGDALVAEDVELLAEDVFSD